MIINALSPTSKSQCFSLALTGVFTKEEIENLDQYYHGGESKFETKIGQWATGRQISSPGYFYYRDFGVDSRIGLDSPVFGDFWQNLPHGPIGTPQFDPNNGRGTKLYLYNQFYNPYTPW
jgi:hypothetical protein